MSGNPQQQPPQPRRVTNVGSMLLTLQENESLFSFLGKKCVVSPGPSSREVRVVGCPWYYRVGHPGVHPDLGHGGLGAAVGRGRLGTGWPGRREVEGCGSFSCPVPTSGRSGLCRPHSLPSSSAGPRVVGVEWGAGGNEWRRPRRGWQGSSAARPSGAAHPERRAQPSPLRRVSSG